MTSQGIIEYGNDDTLPDLKDEAPDFYNCVITSATNNGGTLACDATVGSVISGTGYCAQDKYKAMTYCACVNPPIANALCSFAPCANSTYSYKPTTQVTTVNDQKCPSSISCFQINEIGGSHNVVSDISQQQNCGGVIQTFVTDLMAHPLIAVVVFILLLSLVLLIIPSRGKTKAPLPPPSLVLPDELM